MPLFDDSGLRIAKSINAAVYCNPFLTERVDAERAALGDRFVDPGPVWNNAGLPTLVHRPNLSLLQAEAERLIAAATKRLRADAKATPAEASLYEGVVMYALYYRQHPTLEQLAGRPHVRSAPKRATAEAFDLLRRDLDRLLTSMRLPGIVPPDAAHLFACFFQIARAFHQIFSTIVGTSAPAAQLRGAIWQSIFTHDMRRYRRALFDKTGDFTTLVLGPSGTGKELVARAIGASRFIPFDATRKAFTEDVAASFLPLNLSALSPTLVESELFGHRRGAFTGAVEDRKGWLQACPPLGTVFLDEIGELAPAIQVKLLRVLQSRTFERLGDTQTLTFRGKIIAATNRDLHAEVQRGGGEFRRDLYYRLCSDVITTPSLREQLDAAAEQSAGGARDELRRLVYSIALRLLPDEADKLADQAMDSIARHLGDHYTWPGNFRELEQCVRNVLIRGDYHPPTPAVAASDDWLDAARAGALSADDLLAAYSTHVYRAEGTYERAGAKLRLDRRTVRANVLRDSTRRSPHIG